MANTRAIGGTAMCRRINGPFRYRWIWPFGWSTWDQYGKSWNFHQIAVRQNYQDYVYDPCIKLWMYSGGTLKWVIPINIAIVTYKNYFYLAGTWEPQDPFNYIIVL